MSEGSTSRVSGPDQVIPWALRLLPKHSFISFISVAQSELHEQRYVVGLQFIVGKVVRRTPFLYCVYVDGVGGPHNPAKGVINNTGTAHFTSHPSTPHSSPPPPTEQLQRSLCLSPVLGLRSGTSSLLDPHHH